MRTKPIKVENTTSFSVNDRVGTEPVLDPSGYADVIYGRIVELNGEKALVKWDEPAWKKGATEEYVKTLFPEASVKAMICGLEKDFAKVSDEIKVKMELAGKLLKEASILAESVGAELHFMDGIAPLHNSMEEIGWNTSSLTSSITC